MGVVKTIGKGLLAVLAVATAWLYVRPYFNTFPEQDECSFGPVSNARYRELLTEARRRQGSRAWPRLSGDNRDMSANLQARLDDLTRGMDSIYERIAAIHAIGRALGGAHVATVYLRSSRVELNNDFIPVTMMFMYYLDVHKVGGFAPLLKNAKIMFYYFTDRNENSANTQVKIPLGVDVAWPHTILDPPARTDVPQPNSSCPSLSSEEWVHNYQIWLGRAPSLGEK